jgi:hypothetical protein
MTIQVQHHQPDVLITTTSCSTSSDETWKPPIDTLLSSNDDFMLFHKPLLPFGSRPDDDESVMTLSSTSSSDLESNSIARVVTFAPELVTEEWTRPYTPTEDLGKLYYSTQETQRYVRSCLPRSLSFYTSVKPIFEFEKNSHTLQKSACWRATSRLSCRVSFLCSFRFRQEYRIERKLLGSAPSLGDEDESLGDLWEVPLPSQSLRFGTRGISRVVVVHNDTLATFSSPTPLVGNGSADGENCVSTSDSSAANKERASDFFDTPEFWSGSITWW